MQNKRALIVFALKRIFSAKIAFQTLSFDYYCRSRTTTQGVTELIIMCMNQSNQLRSQMGAVGQASRPYILISHKILFLHLCYIV